MQRKRLTLDVDGRKYSPCRGYLPQATYPRKTPTIRHLIFELLDFEKQLYLVIYIRRRRLGLCDI
jgi:hypothetical protein